MQPTVLSRRNIASVAAAAFAFTAVTTPLPTSAGMVSTDQVIAETAAAADRARVTDFLARDDVARQMIELGVDPVETGERVAALSDTEIAHIAGQIDTLPAGEGVGALIAIAGIVFVVLLITDFVGATDVFTFVK